MDDAIRGVLEADPRVRYALVFGSSATGRVSPFSDLDIAVELDAGSALDHRAVGELTARLEQATGRTVDLVLLNEAPPGVAYRAFRDGRVVVETDRAARVARQARAVLEYLDFEPVERRCARAVLDATARG